jgi:hypothetical protein
MQRISIGCSATKLAKDGYPLEMAIKNNQNEIVCIKTYQTFSRSNFACPVYDEVVPITFYTEETFNMEQGADLGYPLHLACRYSQSERVLLVLIHLNLQAVKYEDYDNETPLSIAKRYQKSSTIIHVLEQLMALSDSDLQNNIGIPKIVTLHSLDNLDNLLRHDTFQWVLDNSPILIDGQYIQLM